MNRLLSSWPYALFVLLCWLSWEAAGFIDFPGMDAAQEKSLFLTIALFGYQVLLFLAGTALGYRRGYDWVTILACLGVFVICQGLSSAWKGLPLSVGDLATFSVYYLIPAHLGIAAGLGIRTLQRRNAQPKE